MAGGTWTTQNKILPGFYQNFQTDSANLFRMGERGTMVMPLVLNWGPEEQLVKTQANTDFRTLIGYNIIDSQALLIREALKRAVNVYVYRLNTGVKATVALGNLTATAKYSGTVGNRISVAVETNIIDTSKFDVVTMIDGVEEDTQTVSDIGGLVSNDWVVFTQTGASPTLAATAGASLTGGTSGEVTNQNHTDFMDAVGQVKYNTIALTNINDTLKSVYASFIKRVREQEGFKAQIVVSNYPAADYEGIINVTRGVVLSDGTVITPDQAVAWVAGATAGATVAQSLTYTAYDDAIDADTRLTRGEQEAALTNGEFVFVFSNDQAVVLQDINSLQSFTPTKGRIFSKNRPIRTMDGLANDRQALFERSYIGKIDNSPDGRALFRSAYLGIMLTYQDAGAIEDVDAKNDVKVLPGAESDAITVEDWIKLIDSVEKIYAITHVR